MHKMFERSHLVNLYVKRKICKLKKNESTFNFVAKTLQSIFRLLRKRIGSFSL